VQNVEVEGHGGCAHVAAVLTWIYAAAFGIPAIPDAVYLLRRGRLPTFLNLFPMYGGPWFSRVSHGTFAALLIGFLLVLLLAAWAAWLVWNGSKAGAVLPWFCCRWRPCSGLASRYRSPGCSASPESYASSSHGGAETWRSARPKGADVSIETEGSSVVDRQE